MQFGRLGSDHQAQALFVNERRKATALPAIVDPRDIATPAVWLDASQPTGLGSSATHGQAMLTWTDLSGSGNDANVAEDTPSIRAPGIGGRPAVYFNGNASLRTTALALVSPYTISFVARFIAPNSVNTGRVLGGDANRLVGFWTDASPLPATVYERSLFLTSDIHLETPPARTLTPGQKTFTLRTNGANKHFREQSEVVSDTSTNADTGWGNLWLGRTAFGERSECMIAEVVVYRSALSDADILRLVHYLGRKWYKS